MPLSFTVYGTPAPQGSHRAFVVKGHAVITEASKKLPVWRDAVVLAARRAAAGKSWQMLDGPVHLRVIFHMPRPASVKRLYPSVTPDLDKLVRGVSDALTAAAVIKDDARIIEVYALKLYATDEVAPGATITIEKAES